MTLALPVRPKRLAAYALAVALPLLVLALRLSLGVAFEHRPLLILFMPVVILVAMLGGIGPGLVATATTAWVTAYFLVPPTGSIAIAKGHDLFQWGMLVLSGVMASGLAELLRRSQGREVDNWRQVSAAREQLRESEARFRRLFHEAPLPLCYADRDGVLRDRNARFLQTFGYSEVDVPTLAEWWKHACPDPDHRARVLTTWNVAVADAARSGTDIAPIEVAVTCKDGTRRVMLISGIAIGEDLLVTFFDLTERQRAEQALRAAQAAALEEQKQGRLAALNRMEDANVARARAETALAALAESEARYRTDLERQVNERTAELAAANRELESFAYAVSHDLRAPLRAMSGFTQALKEDFGASLAGEAKTYLDQIDIASRKMSELIDGILTLSRSTRGELRRDRVDLGEMASRLLAQLASNEPERHVAIDVDEKSGLVTRGDARLLEVALANLLGNAWKYTARAAAPRIRFRAEDHDGERWFCVADNGAGFDMAHANRLFQPFQRLHRQDEFPGVGIGLATVQRIVQRHGGRIEAHGVKGEGATFRFTLADSSSESSTRKVGEP